MDKLTLFNARRFADHRGFFEEVYSCRRFSELGISDTFVQDNHSMSRLPGTLRGLHFQYPPYSQGKLVRCVRGAIFDVAVDIRLGGPSYGLWKGFVLSAENGNQLYVPVGFAHGFMTLEPDTEVIYKCTDYYAPEAEASIRWDSCGINWPLSIDPILSEKDAIAPTLANLDSPFIYGKNS